MRAQEMYSGLEGQRESYTTFVTDRGNEVQVGNLHAAQTGVERLQWFRKVLGANERHRYLHDHPSRPARPVVKHGHPVKGIVRGEQYSESFRQFHLGGERVGIDSLQLVFRM